MSLINFLSKILNKLYEYDSVRSIKDYLRPIKHFIFGKSDIYFVVEEIKKARGEEKPVRVVFDVGAAFGDKVLTFLRSFPQATIYCFEPQRESLERLKRRTAHYKERIKIFNFGLLNKNSYVELNITSYKDASSILPLQKYMREQEIQKIEKRKIKVWRLDDFVKQQKIEHIDLIKIDVEGVEKEVLEGGKDTFKDRIDNVFIEISPLRRGPHSRDYVDIFKFLYKSGFSFIGHYGDYFFSKDNSLLKRYFEIDS